MSIKVPVGYEWKPRQIFNPSLRMKSHEYKLCLCDGILKFLLPKRQRTTIFRFCDVVSRICSESISLSEINGLEAEVHVVLALLERDFPVSLHVIVFHLLHHLERFGPVYNWWIFPFERFNCCWPTCDKQKISRVNSNFHL